MSQPLERAVWSFWSKPYQHRFNLAWKSEKHHLLAWILSVETARQHYPESVLYTDSDGAALLVDDLGLNFTHVSTELDQLSYADPQWWTLGKLSAYRAQSKPFVHIDTDVFLWKPIESHIASSGVFTQNPEGFPFNGGSWYRPRLYDERIKQQNGWAPQEWHWYVSRCGDQALCCGVLGGQRADFISYYADTAIKFLTHPKNQSIWAGMEHKVGDNILFEQYFLSACIAYHKEHSTSAFNGLSDACLFQSTEETYHTNRAREIGYTHLIGGAKRNDHLANRLEARVARDYPKQHAQCLHYLKLAA